MSNVLPAILGGYCVGCRESGSGLGHREQIVCSVGVQESFIRWRIGNKRDFLALVSVTGAGGRSRLR